MFFFTHLLHVYAMCVLVLHFKKRGEFSGENSIVVALGANMEIPPSRADQLESVISRAKLVLCQYEIDHSTLKRTFEIAKKHNGERLFKISLEGILRYFRIPGFVTHCVIVSRFQIRFTEIRIFPL